MSSVSPEHPLDACRDSALRILERREHSVAELRRKLRSRSFSSSVTETILAEMVALHYLDDRRFTEVFCRAKTSGSRPWGPARLRAELRRRGVADDVVTEVTASLEEVFGEDAEFGRALEAGRRKWESVQRGSGDPSRSRERLYRFLAGRGFGAGVCRRVIDTLRDEAGAP